MHKVQERYKPWMDQVLEPGFQLWLVHTAPQIVCTVEKNNTVLWHSYQGNPTYNTSFLSDWHFQEVKALLTGNHLPLHF